MPKSELQQELKMKSPFESTAQETILSILRTGDQFQNRFGRLFREYGITSSQYNVLRILRGEGKPLPSLEIGDRLLQVVPAITGLVDRLEKQGLVSRERSTEDRRVVYVELTGKGTDLLNRMDEPTRELEHTLISHLSDRDQKTLIRILAKARAGLSSSD